jgi:hypothetical protein
MNQKLKSDTITLNDSSQTNDVDPSPPFELITSNCQDDRSASEGQIPSFDAYKMTNTSTKSNKTNFKPSSEFDKFHASYDSAESKKSSLRFVDRKSSN